MVSPILTISPSSDSEVESNNLESPSSGAQVLPNNESLRSHQDIPLGAHGPLRGLDFLVYHFMMFTKTCNNIGAILGSFKRHVPCKKPISIRGVNTMLDLVQLTLSIFLYVL